MKALDSIPERKKGREAIGREGKTHRDKGKNKKGRKKERGKGGREGGNG